jgi:GMP reductase
MHQTNKRMHDGHVHEIKKFVEFYGMSSQAAMEKHHGGVSDYRSSEGKIVKVPYRGPVSVTVKDLLGGLRSTCSYVDASCLSELHKKVEFIRCNNTHNRVFGG